MVVLYEVARMIKLLITIPFLVLFLIVFLMPMPESKVYNCDLAEISPDIPIAVKNECRRMRIDR
jgi:hypothetical protein